MSSALDFLTPDVYDEHADKVSVLAPIMRNFGGKHCFHGPIVTAQCLEDNSIVKQQVGLPGEGRVLVVDGGGSLRCALLGDMLAEKAMNNGWSGLIIFGCIRDVDAIRDMALGVQALAATPRKSVRRGWGNLNSPVEFGGVSFFPGNYVYADNNGVLLSESPLL